MYQIYQIKHFFRTLSKTIFLLPNLLIYLLGVYTAVVIQLLAMKIIGGAVVGLFMMAVIAFLLYSYVKN